MILADGRTVGFDHRVRDGQRIAVYPPFRSLDLGALPLVAAEPPPLLGFVLDGHLGKLARYLRLLGFDSRRDQDWTDPELVEISVGEGRVLLTRDVGLLMHGVLRHGYFVRATDPRRQVTEVAERFNLPPHIDAFTRCLACNGVLRDATRAEIASRVLPQTWKHFDDFRECPDCGRVYWEGSHYRRLQAVVAEVAGKSRERRGDGGSRESSGRA